MRKKQRVQSQVPLLPLLLNCLWHVALFLFLTVIVLLASRPSSSSLFVPRYYYHTTVLFDFQTSLQSSIWSLTLIS